MILLFSKKRRVKLKKILDLLASYPICQKFLKESSANKSTIHVIKIFSFSSKSGGNTLIKKELICVILVGLSKKSLITINHCLLLTKFSITLLKTRLPCKTRFLRTSLVQFRTFSHRTEMLAGVSQGFILGLLSFSMFLNSIFLFITNSNLC